jgi:hypothetical protein
VKKKLVYFILLLIFLASSWSLLHPKFFRVHDYTHAARISEMTLALKEGHFPVRWTKNFGFGYGMPLFEFYAPLPFYVGSLFYFLGFDIVLVLKFLFFICSAGTLIGAYKLGKKLIDERAGLLLAAALTLAPYRAVNLYVRGALSEAWGMMAFPWILLGMIQVINKEKKGWLTLLFSLVVLMLSHNISVMIFLPFALLFAVFYLIFLILKKDEKYYQKRLNKRAICQSITRILLSILFATTLSAFYLFPAFLEKNFTRVEDQILSLYFDYNLHFVYLRQFFRSRWGFGGSEWGPNDGISFFLGFGQLLGLSVAVLFLAKFLIQFLRVQKKRKFCQKLIASHFLIFSSLAVFLIALLMTTFKSKFIWDLIPVLKFVQFPWRFLAIATMFLAILLALNLSLIKNKAKQKLYFISLLSILILTNFYYFRPKEYLERSADYYYTDEKNIQTRMSEILPDYIPAQMSGNFPAASKLILNDLDKKEFKILINRTHEKLIEFSLPGERRISLSLADYPGWQVRADGQDIEKKQGEVGNIEFDLPEGKSLVEIEFGSTPIRFWSDLTSLASFLILLALLVEFKGKHYD